MKNTETAKQESPNDYNLENIEPFRPRPHFEIDNRGVWWVNVRTDKDGDIIEAEPLLLSDPIDIIGTGQDNDGAYYRIIKFKRQNHTPTKDRRHTTSRNRHSPRLAAFAEFRPSHHERAGKKGKTSRLFAERGKPGGLYHYRPRRLARRQLHYAQWGNHSQRPTKTPPLSTTATPAKQRHISQTESLPTGNKT